MKYFLMVIALLYATSVSLAGMTLMKDVSGTTTYPSGWIIMKTVDSNDPNVSDPNSVLVADPNTGWTYSNATSYSVDPRWTGMVIQAIGYGDNDVNDANYVNDPNAGTFKWELFVSKRYGNLQKIAYGTWSIGNTLCLLNPETGQSMSGIWKYGVKPVITDQQWFTTIAAKGFANGPGYVYFSTHSIDSVLLRVNKKKLVNKLIILVTGTQ